MKLKKNIAIFFTCYYLLISIGLTITLHFCGGNLAGIATFSSKIVCEDEVKVDICCAEKKVVDNGCCSDEVIDFSEVEEDAVLESLDYLSLFAAVIPNYDSYFFRKKTTFQNKIALPNYTFQSNAPPRYKLFSSYIYYA